MGKKYVYLFREGAASMRDLLGGKGANLAEMTQIGLPVPPGFTLTTEEACNEYFSNGEKVPDETGHKILGKTSPELSVIKAYELIDKINFLNEQINSNINEILEIKDVKRLHKLIKSTLNQINKLYKTDPKIYFKIINNPMTRFKINNLKIENKKLKENSRFYRKLDENKAKVAIVRAKSFLRRMFDSLGEFSKKAVAIYGFCRIILDIVDHINKLVQKKMSRCGSFLFSIN